MGDAQDGIQVPVGLATVIGARPDLAPERLPRLPSAPPVVVDATDGRASATDLAAVDRFLRDLGERRDPIVLSVTGPVTLWSERRRAGGDPDDAARFAHGAVVAAASQLLDLARRHAPDAGLLLFLEEPALTNSMHPTFPLSADEIAALIAATVSAVDGLGDHGTTLGVQVGGRADWAMLLATGIGALAAPITAQLQTASAEIGRFLESGGLMAWGAVPVDEPLGQSIERLWRRLSDLWCELARRGVDPLLLRERSIITPAAGLEHFRSSQAARIVALADELATRVLHQTVGVRLSIGA
jgi:hypothetical protein